MRDAMRRLTRMTVGAVARYGGLLPWLERAASGNGLPRVLYYHRVADRIDPTDLGLSVSTGNFEAQVRYLASRYDVRALGDLLRLWAAGEALPPRAIAVTFDDGYRDNYDRAYPILRRYRVPATVFVTTGHVGTATPFWWQRVGRLLADARRRGVPDLPAGAVGLPEAVRARIRTFLGAGGSAALASAVDAFKPLGAEGRDAAVAALEAAIGGGTGTFEGPRMFLSWEEIREMARHGIDFGSHTHTHAILTEIPEVEAERELVASKAALETALDRPVDLFAYPDGCVDARVREQVARAGYTFAVQTQRHAHVFSADPLALPRTKVKEGHSLGPRGGFAAGAFALEVAGASDRLFLRHARKRNPYLGQD